MSLIEVVKNYIKKMVKESDVGYKIMLMDKYTTSFVSLVVGMSQIMRDEVYMFERLDHKSSSENMSYLRCIVFIRPTSENIAIICQELQKPRYGSYYIYFSNVISKNEVKLLAEADENEVIQEVQEIYADFLALSPHFFSLSLPIYSYGLKWAPEALQRSVLGLSGVLFSLQQMPTIRFQNNSEMCRSLAENIKQNLMKEGLLYTENQPKESCLLLIVDRRDDPITPLLDQWTYEAMVHELLGINNGRVSLAHLPGVPEELKEVVMTPSQDEFYAKSMYLNYGDIGQTIKDLMEEYQRKLSKQQKVESLTDMKHFVENYPEFKKMSGTVSKHVTILGELSRLVATHKLLEVSECQQELVCGADNHSSMLQRIRDLIVNSKVRERDAVKLVTLYALRYQKQQNNDTKGLITALKKRSVPESSLKNIASVLEYGGSQARQSDLFESELPQDVSSIKRRLFKGIKGVDNVYTQHRPLLVDTVNNLLKGRLKETQFPVCGGSGAATANPDGTPGARPQVVVVFVVGGVTHEEAHAVHLLNTSSPGLRVYLGGTSVLNSQAFIQVVDSAMEGISRRALRIVS